MAISNKGINLEELKEERTSKRKERKELTVVEIGKHLENDSIGRRLDIDLERNFNSIFGKTFSVGNVMRYLSFKDARPTWIDGEMHNEDFAFMKRSSSKRNVPNYWNILTLVTSDRLLSDLELLSDINTTYPGIELSKIRIMPMLEVKRGLIKDIVFHDRLKVYGIILGIHIRLILEAFRELHDDKSFNELTDEELKAFKLSVKTTIIDRVFENLKSDNLLDELNGASNEDVRKSFLNI